MELLAGNHKFEVERLGDAPILSFPRSFVDVLRDFAKRHFRPPKCFHLGVVRGGL